jgi:hypothetical protein
MKASEFEAKLGMVSDAKLRQMLAASRSQGPEVAVSMILAEARRRGMDDTEGYVPDDRYPERPGTEGGDALAKMAVATSSYPKEGAGAFGSDGPSETVSAEGMTGNGSGAGGVLADSAAPALAPEWLTEETKSGMPMALKALLLIGFVGGLLALAWKFTR